MSQETPDNASANANSESNTQQPTQPQAASSNALAFRAARQNRQRPQEVTLESGLKVTIQRKSVEGLMMRGIIPKDIANKILNMQAMQGGQKRIQVDDLEVTRTLQRTVLEQCMLSPKLMPEGTEPNYENDEIGFDDLDDADVNSIYNACVGVSSKAVNSFRSE